MGLDPRYPAKLPAVMRIVHHTNHLGACAICHPQQDTCRVAGPEGFVPRFSENNRRMPLPLRERDMTFRNLAFHQSAIGQGEGHSLLWLQPDRLPVSMG